MEDINQSVDIILHYDGHYHHEQDDYALMTKLPSLHLQSTRPLYAIQREDITKVRHYFNNKNWCLLPSFNTDNMMYLCDSMEYHRKVSPYFMDLQAYTFIDEFHSSNKDHILESYLDSINKEIHKQLKNLLHDHSLTMAQYQHMTDHECHPIQFNSVFFLPDTQLVSYIIYFFFDCSRNKNYNNNNRNLYHFDHVSLKLMVQLLVLLNICIIFFNHSIFALLNRLLFIVEVKRYKK
jgi:hypothetical protein